ncbi:MAG: ATP-binding protein [Bacteroidota bacterium]
MSSLRQGVAVVSPERRILFVNPLFCELVFSGLTPADLMGKSGVDLADRFKDNFQDPDGFTASVQEIYTHKQPVIGELIRLQDGRLLSRDYTPIYQADELVAHVWTYQQAEIEKQRHFYEQILNNIPADIAVFDKDHRYLFVNPQGIRNPELRAWIIHKNDEEYCDHRQRPYSIFQERRAAFNQAIQTQKQAEWEEELINPSGEAENHYRKMFPVVNEQGQVDLVIGYGMNVTAIKQAQAVLQRAKQEAEANAKAKEDFLARVSHELRTPMNGIIGLTDLLDRSALDEKQSKYIQLLRHSAQSLVSIVNEVLDIEKIGSGKMELHPEEFVLSERMQALMDLFQETALAKGLNLSLDLQNGVAESYRSDINRILQVLGNLLSNALKFTDQGLVSLQVHASEESMVCFRVIDTGIGIEQDSLERVFEPFVQAHVPGQTQRAGTGLGLTICKELAALMGGTIAVESQIGSGSTFTFSLPLSPVETHKEPPDRAEQLATVEALGGKRILLVEDVPLNRFLVEEMTRDWGISLEMAVDGAEGLQKARHTRYDLILMDIQVPLMDGVQVTLAIRQLEDPVLASVPIVALSANAFETDRRNYLKAGMNDTLSKPFDAGQLLDVVWKTLSAGHAATQQTDQKAIDSSRKLVIDLAYLNRVGNGNPEFVRMMLHSFVDSVEESCADLKAHLQRGDRRSIGEVVHKLKFALGVVGVTELKETVAYLEAEGKGMGEPSPESEYGQVVTLFINEMSQLRLKAGDLKIEDGVWCLRF